MQYLELDEQNGFNFYESFEELVELYKDTRSLIETTVDEERITLWEIGYDTKTFTTSIQTLKRTDDIEELLDNLIGDHLDPVDIEALCEAYDINQDLIDEEDDDDYDDDDYDDNEDEEDDLDK